MLSRFARAFKAVADDISEAVSHQRFFFSQLLLFILFYFLFFPLIHHQPNLDLNNTQLAPSRPPLEEFKASWHQVTDYVMLSEGLSLEWLIVCVCVCERERERDRMHVCVSVKECLRWCACICVYALLCLRILHVCWISIYTHILIHTQRRPASLCMRYF